MGNPEACGKVGSLRTNPPLSEKLALKRDRRHVDPIAIPTDSKDDSTCETGLMCSRSRSVPEILVQLEASQVPPGVEYETFPVIILKGSRSTRVKFRRTDSEAE